MNFINIVLNNSLTSIDNWFALEKNCVNVEDCGVVGVQNFIYNHVLQFLEKFWGFHHVCLRVHLYDVLVAELVLDHHEVLVVIDEL